MTRQEEYEAKCRKWVQKYLHAGTDVLLTNGKRARVLFVQERGCYFKIHYDVHLYSYGEIANREEIEKRASLSSLKKRTPVNDKIRKKMMRHYNGVMERNKAIKGKFMEGMGSKELSVLFGISATSINTIIHYGTTSYYKKKGRTRP